MVAVAVVKLSVWLYSIYWPHYVDILCRIEIKTLRRQQRIQMLENAENQKEALEKEKQEMLLGKIESYTII